jgi:hypothetical protein
MNPSAYRVRRATVDDLPGLIPLWDSMRLPAAELERRLKEFQLIETEDGTLLGALGMEVAGRHGLLHSEVFNDFALADGLRALLWERIQSVASNLGLTRLWTVESALFWKREGFAPGSREIVAKLPSVWAAQPGDWLTIELRDEEALRAAVETAYARLKQEHIHESQAVLRRARVWKFIAVTLGLIVALAGIVFCIYLLRQYPRLLHSGDSSRVLGFEFGFRRALISPGQMKFIGVVRTPHHRPAGHMDETHFLRARLVFGELLRPHKFNHRQMFQRRLQILAQCENIALRRAQIAHRGQHFLFALAQAEHHAGLRV